MVLSLFLLNFGAAWVHPRCGAPFLRHRSQRCDNRKRKVSVFRGAHVSIVQQQPLASQKPVKTGPRSGRQGRKSGKVKVLSPSIACIGRIAYPVRAEVTKHVLVWGKNWSRSLP